MQKVQEKGSAIKNARVEAVCGFIEDYLQENDPHFHSFTKIFASVYEKKQEEKAQKNKEEQERKKTWFQKLLS